MIIKNNFTLGDNYWASYEPEMENGSSSGGAVDDEINEILEGQFDVGWMWIGGSPMSPYTGKLREVKVDISSYTGMGSIGAEHYYVKVYEEYNMLWSWKKKSWLFSSRDHRFLGLAIHNGSQFNELEFTTIAQAIKWAKEILPIYFPGHKLDEDWEDDYEDW